MSPPHAFIGAITGTSVDGLDLAMIEMGPPVRILGGSTRPFPEALRRDLLALGQPGADDLDRIGELDGALGTFIGEAVADFLRENGLEARAVAAIGSHGQTIRHRPHGRPPFTWQIGDPNRIAEITGITTVADFRRRDMAAGGQGAPLVPPFHEALFQHPAEPRVVVNIGGIANLTHLPAQGPLTGFDTGPGNGLLDAWCQRHTGNPYDDAGQWARSGTVLPRLLEAMEKDGYLARTPPKSTGREVFNLAWLEGFAPDGEPADVQRTLLELTARSIVAAVRRWASPAARLIVCGGGRRNDFLMARLAELSSMPVEPTERHGVDGDVLEAAAFAWLAARRLAGEAGSAPTVTGARGPRLLGAVYPGTPISDGE